MRLSSPVPYLGLVLMGLTLEVLPASLTSTRWGVSSRPGECTHTHMHACTHKQQCVSEHLETLSPRGDTEMQTRDTPPEGSKYLGPYLSYTSQNQLPIHYCIPENNNMFLVL